MFSTSQIGYPKLWSTAVRKKCCGSKCHGSKCDCEQLSLGSECRESKCLRSKCHGSNYLGYISHGFSLVDERYLVICCKITSIKIYCQSLNFDKKSNFGRTYIYVMAKIKIQSNFKFNWILILTTTYINEIEFQDFEIVSMEISVLHNKRLKHEIIKFFSLKGSRYLKD
jgi:hypothetical protein